MSKMCDLCQVIVQNKATINVLELYSGIGGMHYGILNSGLSGDLNVTAIDINPNANSVYRFNFLKSSKILSKNLASISVQEFDKLQIDICTMSPPCQPFTRQHSNQQLEERDHRTESLDHLIVNVFPNLVNKPKYFLIENVKNFEKSKIATKLLKMFDEMGYDYQQFLLQPFQFGIPNSRLRYYCLAKKGKFCFETNKSILENYPRSISEKSCSSCLSMFFSKDELILSECSISGHSSKNFELNKTKFELKPISNYLEEEDPKIGEFMMKQETIRKYLPAIDIVKRSAESSNCFTSSYGHYLTGTGSFLLMNEFSTNEIAKLKKESENVSNLLIRKFKPKEIANLMGFPLDFKLPEHITLKQAYKLLGNSVNVKVISYLMKILLLNESVHDQFD